MHEFYLTTFMHDSGTGSPWGSETGSVSWARWHTETENDPHAWRRMPEWNRSSDEGAHPAIAPLRSVRDIFTERQVRATEVGVIGNIPDMELPFTFGRAEEWLRSERLGVNDEERAANRLRLQTALANIAAETPAAVRAPRRRAQVADDLGGVPIEDGE
jgi:hypothetical protein